MSDIGCNQTVMLARKMLILANELSNISKCDLMSPPDVHCPITNQLLHDNLSDPLHSYNLQLSSLILSQRSSAPSWTRRQRNTASWLYLETQVHPPLHEGADARRHTTMEEFVKSPGKKATSLTTLKKCSKLSLCLKWFCYKGGNFTSRIIRLH